MSGAGVQETPAVPVTASQCASSVVLSRARIGIDGASPGTAVKEPLVQDVASNAGALAPNMFTPNGSPGMSPFDVEQDQPKGLIAVLLS